MDNPTQNNAAPIHPLAPTSGALTAAGGLMVYVGQHGNIDGVFDPDEMAAIIDTLSGLPELLGALCHVRAALNCHYDWRSIERAYGAEIDAAIARAGQSSF